MLIVVVVMVLLDFLPGVPCLEQLGNSMYYYSTDTVEFGAWGKECAMAGLTRANLTQQDVEGLQVDCIAEDMPIKNKPLWIHTKVFNVDEVLDCTVLQWYGLPMGCRVLIRRCARGAGVLCTGLPLTTTSTTTLAPTSTTTQRTASGRPKHPLKLLKRLIGYKFCIAAKVFAASFLKLRRFFGHLYSPLNVINV